MKDRYYYTNNLGRKKCLKIDWNDSKDNEFYSAIWDETTGELCSCGYNTKEEIISFLTDMGCI